MEWRCIAHFVGVLIFVAGLVVVIRTGNLSVVIPGAILVLLATLTYAVYSLPTTEKANDDAEPADHIDTRH